MAVDTVVFDLDGTLLRGPTVCEVLARPLGRLERMQEIEQLATDRDELAAARVEMAEWYLEVERDWLLACLDEAELAPGALEACASLREAGVRIAIASITWEAAVARFAARFGADRWIGTIIADDGTIGASPGRKCHSRGSDPADRLETSGAPAGACQPLRRLDLGQHVATWSHAPSAASCWHPEGHRHTQRT